MASRGSKGPAAPWWARCSPPSAPGGSASTRRGFSWPGRASAWCSRPRWARGWNIAVASVSVDEAAVAKNVVDRVPQDTGSVFPVDVGQLVLWTKVSGAAGTALHHVWFHGDTQVGDVELQVGGSPWRTWSRKTVPADWTGAWHVEVRDAAGAVLKRIDFTVGQ